MPVGIYNHYKIRGRRLSEEHKRKISESEKGKIVSDNTRRKIGLIFKGKKLSIEHINKIKENHSRYWLNRKRPLFSKEWRKKIGDANRKEKSIWWKGGITPEYHKIRTSIEFRLWREAVFARDNWTCQKCKIRGGQLHPHHIQNFAQYPELRFAIDNGITLCKNCHQRFHKEYGVKNNTKEQLKDFLN